MKGYVGSGDYLTLTAPSGGVVSGGAYLIGSLVVIAAADAAQGVAFACMTEGVFSVAKAAGVAWTEGLKIYWDNVAKNFTTVSTSNQLVGVAATAATSGATSGLVYLDGATR